MRRLQILVIPLPSAESHTFVMVKIVEELVARGNDILVSGCACGYLYSDTDAYIWLIGMLPGHHLLHIRPLQYY